MKRQRSERLQSGQLFRDRLRRPPTPWSVDGSLPVLFFGDIDSAKVATVGLNPSDREYTDEWGELLAGADQRFATLPSLHAASRMALTDEQCDVAVEWMRRYFETGRPVYGHYFRTLMNFLAGWGVDFGPGGAVHLDLVQEVTDPRWSELGRTARASLLKTDLPFLRAQIEASAFDAVICTGQTVSAEVRELLDVQVIATGELAMEVWWTGSAVVGGRRVRVAGWNRPLHQPTGLGTAGELKLGQLLRAKLER